MQAAGAGAGGGAGAKGERILRGLPAALAEPGLVPARPERGAKWQGTNVVSLLLYEVSFINW